MTGSEILNAAAEGLRSDQERTSSPRLAPLWTVLSDDTSRLVHALERLLEREHPQVFGSFGSVEELRVALVDAYEDDPGPFDSIDGLTCALRAGADQTWLVASPLVNVQPPTELEALDPDTALVPTQRGRRVPDQTQRDLQSMFGARLDVGSRLEQGPEDETVDSRHTASLVTRESGSRGVSERRAMAKAQFLVATWTLLSTPQDESCTPLWPVVSEWLPGPWFEVTQRSTQLKTSRRRTGRGHFIVHVDDETLYEPPSGPARSAALRAAGRAGTSHAAACLLAATWSLSLAARPQTEMQWIDRLALTVRAREALCAPPIGSERTAYQRWRLLERNVGVAQRMQEAGFDDIDIGSVTTRAWDLRNIGTHSADSALIALGYPPERSLMPRSGRMIEGTQLGPLHIREGTEPPFAAAKFACEALWARMLATDFEDSEFEQLFED